MGTSNGETQLPQGGWVSSRYGSSLVIHHLVVIGLDQHTGGRGEIRATGRNRKADKPVPAAAVFSDHPLQMDNQLPATVIRTKLALHTLQPEEVLDREQSMKPHFPLRKPPPLRTL